MSKGVHNIAFYVSPDPECSRTTQNSEISLAPSRGCILYAIYGNSTCVINHIVVTAIDKRYRNYYVSTVQICRNSGHTPSRFAGTPAALSHLLYRFAGTPAALSHCCTDLQELWPHSVQICWNSGHTLSFVVQNLCRNSGHTLCIDLKEL